MADERTIRRAELIQPDASVEMSFITSPPPQLAVANFNLHAGVDGWGRPFDIIKAAKIIDADVLVLEEVFAEDGEASQAQQIADALGYSCYQAALGRLTVKLPDPAIAHRRSWGPRPMVRGIFSAVVAERAKTANNASGDASTRKRGTISIAVLARVPVHAHDVIDLPRLRRDKIRRRAIVLELGDPSLRIVGTHLGHLSHGSHREIAFLRAHFENTRVVFIGDMNCWGPPLQAMLGGSRAVRGRTWPAWRPHSQIDHIVVKGGVRSLSAEVLAPLGSDHRPVRAVLSW